MSAMMEQFSIAEQTLDTALNKSAGSAERELGTMQKGIEYSISQFKATFQELSTSALSSDLFKGVVDSATSLLSVLEQIISVGGGIPAMLSAIGGYKIFKNLD